MSKCSNCGGEGHNIRTCTLTGRTYKCSACGYLGHNKRTCPVDETIEGMEE